MGTVQSITLARALAIEAGSIVSGYINGTGHLILVKFDGTLIDAGYMIASVPSATSTVSGIVELATDAEATTGTDTVRAITPANLAAVVANRQPLDSDLTAFAALTPANNDIVQRKAGAWTNRTIAQLKTDLALALADVSGLVTALNNRATDYNYGGSSYAATTSAGVYVGPVDPGSVPDGSVWYQTAT